jgi:bifunctional non-homologous end joining protein LigD
LCPIIDGTWDQPHLAGRQLVDIAWDGHRVLASRYDDRSYLRSADGQPWHDLFAPIAACLRRLKAGQFVAEGYLVALDEHGRPCFDRLVQAVAERSTTEAVLVLWDLHSVERDDVRERPLHGRRERLRDLLQGAPANLVFSEPLCGELEQLRRQTAALGIRGLVVRDPDAAYPDEGAGGWLALSHGDAPIAEVRSLSPPPMVTNPDKVLFPRDGLTKREIVGYYALVAPVLLPHLRERPVVGQRWPDGIDAFTWYQHRVPPRRIAPDYLRAIAIEDDQRMLIDDERALRWLVNQAALTFHGWASRAGSLDQPDWSILDLDPGERTSWETTIGVANALRRLLELLELPSVVKTSGQAGLHILVPLPPGQSPQTAHDLARGLARIVAKLHPDEVTLDPRPESRVGRLYLDHLQNYVGKILVAPYSLRAADGAPVSTPLAWSEVTPRLDPRAFTMHTIAKRLDAHGDLAAPLLQPGAPIQAALDHLRDNGVL